MSKRRKNVAIKTSTHDRLMAVAHPEAADRSAGDIVAEALEVWFKNEGWTFGKVGIPGIPEMLHVKAVKG